MFTGEEYYGKYVDLHEEYEKYVNLPHIYRVDYITYLGSFYNFKEIGMDTKMTSVAVFFVSDSRHILTIYLLFWITLLPFVIDLSHSSMWMD